MIRDSLKDLRVNHSLILENNFDNINAIDWEKGCYIGQEITARIKYRSLLKKNLAKVKILKGQVKPGDEIFYEKKIIGKITSSNQDIALAMIRITERKEVINNNLILESKNAKISLVF